MKRWCLVGLCLWLAAIPAHADEIDDAKVLLGTDKHAEGVARIRKAIAAYEKQGSKAEAVRRAGVGYFFLEDDAKAKAAFTKAIELAPKEPKNHYWLGVLLQYSDLEAAEKVMAKAASLAPDRPMYHYELGEFQRLLERPEAALAAYRRVLELDDEHARAHMRVGNLLFFGGKREEATKHLERALTLDGSLLLARYNVGQMHYDAGRYKPAHTHWAIGAEQAPGDFGFQKKTIQALYALDQEAKTAPYRKRLAAIRKGMKMKPSEFCFDQFRAGKLRVLAYERFEKGGDLYYHYVFKVVDADDNILRKINLESSKVLRELGKAFILGMTHPDGSHETMGPTFGAMPAYADLKRLVIDAADGQLTGQPGIKVETSKGAPGKPGKK